VREPSRGQSKPAWNGTDAIRFAQANQVDQFESTVQAEQDWAAEVNRAGSETIMASGANANAWFIGANIPGKPIEFNVYMGGADSYFKRCDEVARNSYHGFLPEPARTWVS
jgi:hypothetical protein